MNLRLMSLLIPGLRYSSHPAPVPEATRLAVSGEPQIPKRQPGVVTRKGIRFRDGLRLDLVAPAATGPHPLVVCRAAGSFGAPRGMAGRARSWPRRLRRCQSSTGPSGGTRPRPTASDVRAAVDHLDQAQTYGIDPNRIGLWGESAGGYLASVAGSPTRGSARRRRVRASDLSVVADGFDERMLAALADPRNPIRRYRAAETNPVDLVRADSPAFLILHGDDDRIIPPTQTLALHRALHDAGADSTHHLLAGAGHGMMALNRRQEQQWTSVQVCPHHEFLDGRRAAERHSTIRRSLVSRSGRLGRAGRPPETRLRAPYGHAYDNSPYRTV
jgi:dienelactone hydrolase